MDASSVPVAAAVTSAGQTKKAKLGQPMSRPGSPATFVTPSATPLPENPRAQTSLAAPGVEVWTPVVCEVLLGANEYDRSLQVMIGTIVSTRLSTAAAANCTWPP